MARLEFLREVGVRSGVLRERGEVRVSAVSVRV